MTAIANATDSTDVEAFVQAVKDLQVTVEQQVDRIDALETELAEYQDHIGREFADVRSQIADVEDDLEAQNQQTEAHSEGAHPGDKQAWSRPLVPTVFSDH